jgi:hypothetical protein
MKVLLKLGFRVVHHPELFDGWLSSDLCGYQIVVRRVVVHRKSTETGLGC